MYQVYKCNGLGHWLSQVAVGSHHDPSTCNWQRLIAYTQSHSQGYQGPLTCDKRRYGTLRQMDRQQTDWLTWWCCTDVNQPLTETNRQHAYTFIYFNFILFCLSAVLLNYMSVLADKLRPTAPLHTITTTLPCLLLAGTHTLVTTISV